MGQMGMPEGGGTWGGFWAHFGDQSVVNFVACCLPRIYLSARVKCDKAWKGTARAQKVELMVLIPF